MAFVGKPETPRPRPRYVGIEPHIMAELVQLSCEIEDVKPPSGRDRNVEPSRHWPALWLGTPCARRIRFAASEQYGFIIDSGSEFGDIQNVMTLGTELVDNLFVDASSATIFTQRLSLQGRRYLTEELRRRRQKRP